MLSENISGSNDGTPGETLVETDPHDMTEEELSKANIEEDKDDQLNTPAESSEAEASDKSTLSEETDKKDDSIPDDDEQKSDAPASDKETPGVKDGDEEPTGDRVHDAQVLMHKKATQLAEAKREIADLNKRVRELEEPGKPRTYDLTEAELEILRLDDPNEYVRITLEKNKYDVDKGNYDQKVEDAEAEQVKIAQDLAMQTTIDSITVFAKDFLKIEGGQPGEIWSNQPKEIQDLYDSDKFQKVISFIEANPKKWYESDGSISQETLGMVYKNLHFDDLAGLERVNGRREAVTSMRDAATGGSPLDRTAKEESGAGRGGGKSPEKYTQAEINDMSEKELASRVAEFGVNDEEDG